MKLRKIKLKFFIYKILISKLKKITLKKIVSYFKLIYTDYKGTR